jgi:Tol biopolymer transport system component
MLPQGKQVAQYEIVSLLGAGGMGEVYRARDTKLGRSVALKILSPDLAGDAGRKQRFEFEARAASALNHPGIVSVYDTGEFDGIAYIVSELVEGEMLRDIVKRGPMPHLRVADISAQVADALAAAHSAGVIHRDLKPENVMVTKDGRAKILDFGLAKQVAPQSTDSDATALLTRTNPGTVMGTAAYMSPEQIKGEIVDSRSDIFSLGIIIHECLTGKQPFERTTAVEMMTAILREDPPDLPDNVPPALRLIVAHCLEKEPDRRFHSARDLAFALRTVTQGGRLSGSQAVMAKTAAAGKRRWVWPLITAFLGALVVLLAIPHVIEPERIELANYHLTPFAPDDEAQIAGAWSPDGKSIAYLRKCSGTAQLMVRGLDSSAPVQLTNSDAAVTQLFWSPDASLLYYIAGAHDGELWAISPAGGKARRILTDISAATMSPDGKSLAIWRPTKQQGKVRGSVWISSPPGSAPKEYQPSPFASELPDAEDRMWFSPDGSSILLVTSHDTAQVWLLPFPAGNGQPHRVLKDIALGITPHAAWLPDNRHVILAFGPGLPPRPALWLADLRNDRMRRLTAGTAGHGYPSLSPDGRRMVFTAVQDDYDVVQLPLDGTDPHTLIHSRNELSPSWSSDGDQLIYSSDRDNVREIWIHHLKAGLDQPIITEKAFPPGSTIGLADPVFSPEGDRFAFVRYSTNEPATIWIAPSVGGAPIRLTTEHIHSPAWSPDGNWIVGLMHHDAPSQPAIVGVGTDMSAHVVPNGPTCRTAPDWSPSGDWLACGTRDGIALFSQDGARSRMLADIRCSGLAFARDGKSLYIVGRERGKSFLRAVDVKVGTVRTVAEYGPSVSISGGRQFDTRVTVAPDGKSVATSVESSKSELWLLDGYPLPRPWWRFW